jgi:hypothetical protein
MPDKCPMYICAITCDNLNFWDSVYGFKMPNIKDKVHRQLVSEPVVDHFNGDKCALTDAFMFRGVDCQAGTVSLLHDLFVPSSYTCSYCYRMLCFFSCLSASLPHLYVILSFTRATKLSAISKDGDMMTLNVLSGFN